MLHTEDVTSPAPRSGTRVRNAYTFWGITTPEERLGFSLGAGPCSSRNERGQIIEAFTTRLKAESTLDVHFTAGFRFTDGKEECALEIRRGVAQFHDGMPKTHDLVMTLDRRTLESILKGSTDLSDAVASHAMRVWKGARQRMLNASSATSNAPSRFPFA